MKIRNVKQRRDYFMSLLMFKSIHGLAPDHLCNDIVMTIELSDRMLRNTHENDVVIPYVNVDITKRSFGYQGPLVWNNLPSHIKECTEINTFKFKAKQYFIHA